MIHGRVNRPPGHNSYCGPAAISIIAGVTTNAAARAIRLRSRAGNVRGVYGWDLLAAIRDFGFRGIRERWATGSKIVDAAARPGVRVIVFRSHYAVLWDGRYCCGRENGGRPLAVTGARASRRLGCEEIDRSYRIVKLKAGELGEAGRAPDEQVIRALERQLWG